MQCLPEDEKCNTGNGLDCCSHVDTGDEEKHHECVREGTESICKKRILKKPNDEACAGDAYCNSMNCTASICTCTLNAVPASTCNNIFDENTCKNSDCFYDEEESSCKSRQGQCRIDDKCSIDTDCLTGTIVNLPDLNLVPPPEISGPATTGASGRAPPGAPAGIGTSRVGLRPGAPAARCDIQAATGGRAEGRERVD